MKTKRILIVGSIIAANLTIFTGCSMEGALSTASNGEIANVTSVDTKKIEESRIPIREAVARAKTDLEEAKTKYDKFVFDNIYPMCNEMDTVASLKILPLDNYKGITDAKEMHYELMDLLRYYLGKEPDENYLMSKYHEKITFDQYATFREYVEALERGEDLEVSDIGYVKKADGVEESGFIHQTLRELSFNKGKIYTIVPEETKGLVNKAEGENILDYSEDVATYYVNNYDCNLEDTYQLKDGPLSIQDGINLVEDYFNQQFRVEGGDENIRFKVTRVDVKKLSEDWHYYRYSISREIHGVYTLVKTDKNGHHGYYRDYNYAFMVYTNEIDSCDTNTNRLNCETFDETKEIIPLSLALGILEEQLGENSSYQIKNVTLGYMQRIDDKGYLTDMIPCWILDSYNDQDIKVTEFYINVLTGEVTALY